MRTDVFTYHQEKNLDQYFYLLETIEEDKAKGKKNRFRQKMYDLMRKQQALDAKYYAELRHDDTDKWYTMKRHNEKLNQTLNTIQL